MSRNLRFLGLMSCFLGLACASSGAGDVVYPLAASKPAPNPTPVAAAASATPAPAPPPPQPTYSPEVEARIERVLRGLLPLTELPREFGPPAELSARMRYFHTPGVSIAVIHDGKVQWARAFGVRDAKTREPMTTETMLQAASISKPVFALAVMRLVEQGKLGLDEDVDHYLKSWKVPASGDFRPLITLRELLGHSAGLTVHGFAGYHAGEPLPTVPQILDGATPANSPPVRVNILPETAFRYSGGGTTVAMLSVMDQLGQPFPKIMRDLVLDPFGMTHSTYEQPLPEAKYGAAATGHPWKGDPLEGKWHTYPEMGAAGLWTTPTDLCAVGLEMQRAIRGESKLLSKARAEEMVTRNLGDVGIGFFMQGKGATMRFGHNGWNEGFVSLATFYKEKGLGTVIMVNSNEGIPLLEELERAIASEYAWPDYFEPKKKRVELADAELDRLAGTYESENGVRVVVARNGKDLTIQVGKQPALRLAPSETTKFFAPNLALEAEFKVEAKKPAESLVLEQDQRRLEAKRKKSDPLAVRH